MKHKKAFTPACGFFCKLFTLKLLNITLQKSDPLFFLYQGQFFQTFAVQTNAERASYPSPATATTPTTMTDERIMCVSQQQALFHKLNAN